MPIKRLNFTSRKRLTRDQANVVIYPGTNSDPATFDVDLNLAILPPEANSARIFVEAYHQTTRMRFDFGTAAVPVKPPLHERRLVEFSDWRDILFRIKITDVSNVHGRILAWANGIRPRGPQDEEDSDLVRFKDADLYGLLWELDFDDKGPVVLVDGSAGGAQRVGRNDLFIATAYPEILRQALTRALIVDRMPHDDPQHWISRWYDGYLRAKLRMKPPPANNDEACREWIDEAVRAFGRHYQVVRHWATDDPQSAGGFSS